MRHCAKAGYESLVSVPIRLQQRLIGEIDLFFRSPVNLSADEVELLDALASHLASARVRKARLRFASSILPHSTLRKISRSTGSRILATRSHSTTPSPQAQPTGVPVTLPRSSAP